MGKRTAGRSLAAPVLCMHHNMPMAIILQRCARPQGTLLSVRMVIL